MWPISIVNGPIRNDIRLPECFIACYRRLDSRVRREEKEREKKNNEEKRERRGHSSEICFQKVIRPILFPRSHPYPTPSFFLFCFVLFFSAHLSLSCPHDLNACNRLNASVFCFHCFFKTSFSYLNCN